MAERQPQLPDRGSLGQNILVAAIMMVAYFVIGSILKLLGKKPTEEARARQGIPAVSQGYEVRDMSFGAVAAFGIGLLVLLAVIGVVLLVVYGVFLRGESQAQNLPSPLMATPQLPPEPRLEVVPGQELQQLRAQEDQILNSYGWVDQAHGVTRIPIDRAIDLLAQRGLPTRPQSIVIMGEKSKGPQ